MSVLRDRIRFAVLLVLEAGLLGAAIWIGVWWFAPPPAVSDGGAGMAPPLLAPLLSPEDARRRAKAHLDWADAERLSRAYERATREP